MIAPVKIGHRWVGGFLEDPPGKTSILAASPLKTLSRQGARFSRHNGETRRLYRRKPAKTQTGGSCVPNAILRIVENLSDVAGDSLPELSTMWGYRLSRFEHGAENENDGTYIYLCADVLARMGACSYDAWPDDERELVDTPPPARAFIDAYDLKITGHEALYGYGVDLLDQIDDAVCAGAYVAVGLPVSHVFTIFMGGDGAFGPPTSSVGGHAMYVSAVRGEGDAREFELTSSWGDDSSGSTGWGNDGAAWVTAEYMKLAHSSRVFTRV